MNFSKAKFPATETLHKGIIARWTMLNIDLFFLDIQVPCFMTGEDSL